MKTMMTMKILAILMLATAITASAQDAKGRGPQGGPDGNFQPPRPEEIAPDLLAKFDLDKDSKLNEAELSEAIAALPHPPTSEEVAAKWLEEFDADGNGSLTVKELAKALEAHRPPPPPGGPREN